ncbi:a0766a36-f63c-479e-b4ff-94160c5e0a3d-CDS [Sclerotinia trifoliorum]|uniref:A0766a36-f63c-479e-b4ff-94160c5e0a3d-CDS n=1 Tax=Sclerotinia trifoliorum TaxID=28548 RepID=A0A8H2W7A5_9HELO|nr:a0766a36-f63c-479e-b4ff-94160c5e0a3d-CDS [Sclerotinia trifoliorum]
MARPPDFRLPIVYSWFFLIIEPISALIGAYYAHFRPLTYLQLTDSLSSPYTQTTIPLSTSIILTQLANLYLLFAINEALILRCTSDLHVWRVVLAAMLVADFGHLYSVRALGSSIYWNLLRWNVMAWGNVGFVYVGAAMRVAFLRGWGLGTERAQQRAVRSKTLTEGLKGA